MEKGPPKVIWSNGQEIEKNYEGKFEHFSKST